MNNHNYLTLDNGKTAVFTPDTMIIITHSEENLNSPGMVDMNWCVCAQDLIINGASFLHDLTVAELITLCSFDVNLKNHDYVVEAIYSDSLCTTFALHNIEHTVVIPVE
jgi:hypothetical protein